VSVLGIGDLVRGITKELPNHLAAGLASDPFFLVEDIGHDEAEEMEPAKAQKKGGK